jgi:ABC-2 type transport system ATP-binding protein
VLRAYFAAVLNLDNLQKSYGGKSILNIPSFFFAPGMHWLQGKNGSGKSTLFRCIAGMAPFEGSIRLGKFDSEKDHRQYRLRVNYSEAEPLFPGFLSGKEMLQFVADAKRADESQLKELTELFSLHLFYENPASTYSSGMAKKISLIMAFLGKPELILLDEPFITLDRESVLLLSQLISGFRQKGVSFLMSSHPDFQKDGFQSDYNWQLEGRNLIPLP